MEEVNQEVDLKIGAVKIGEPRCSNWEVTWKKFRKYLQNWESKTNAKENPK